MIVTNANLDALRVQFEAKFQEGYSSGKTVFDPLFFDVPSSTASNRYGWIAQQLRLNEWVGPRIVQNLSEHDYTLKNKGYEGTVELDKYDIEDDNLGMFVGATMPQFGEAVRKHTDVLVSQLLTANPVAFDGLSLFNDAHLTYAPAGSVQTYDNNFTLSLTAANLNTMMSTAAAFVGEDGEPLEVRYTHIFIPPQREFEAKQILKSATFSAVTVEGNGAVQIENQWQNALEIVVCPKLAGVPQTYYLADLSKSVKPFVHQVRQAPNFVSRDNPQDPKVFDLRKFTYGTDLRDAMGVTLPFLIARSAY